MLRATPRSFENSTARCSPITALASMPTGYWSRSSRPRRHARDRGAGERRNLSPSGISRSVDRLAKIGLVERSANPADRRSLLVGLTPQGLARLRAAQVTHHAVVRGLLLDRLSERDLKRLGELWEKAMPGSVSSPVWPQ